MVKNPPTMAENPVSPVRQWESIRPSCFLPCLGRRATARHGVWGRDRVTLGLCSLRGVCGALCGETRPYADVG